MRIKCTNIMVYNIADIEEYCTFIKPRKEVIKEIRSFVKFQISMRCSEEGWLYPDDEQVALHLSEYWFSILKETI